MVGSFLPPVICQRDMSYLCHLWLLVHNSVKHVLIMRVTWWVSHKRQELFILRGHLSSLQFLVRSGLFIFLVFCIVFVFAVRRVCLMLPFLQSVYYCVCLRSTSCVPNVTGFSNLSIIVSVFALRLVCLVLPVSPICLLFCLSSLYVLCA
jgi:hypothetical protein